MYKEDFFFIQRRKPTATSCKHLSIPIVNSRSLNTLSQFKEGRDSGLRAMKTRIRRFRVTIGLPPFVGALP